MAAEPHDEEVPPSHEVAQSDMQSDMRGKTIIRTDNNQAETVNRPP